MRYATYKRSESDWAVIASEDGLVWEVVKIDVKTIPLIVEALNRWEEVLDAALTNGETGTPSHIREVQ